MGVIATVNKQPQLPGREIQVLRLASNGMTDKQIANELSISQETVATYWRRILLRFGASSRTEVVAKATEYEAAQRVTVAEAQTEMLMHEIAERTHAQAKELAHRNLLESISEASTSFISGRISFKGIFDQLLTSLLRLTQSQYGFMGEVLQDPIGQPYLRTQSVTNIAWNAATHRFYDENMASGLEFRNLDTLFGQVMTSGQTVISNDPATDPRAKGVPPGHPALKSFLGLPVIGGNDLVGMIGIANRPGGYSTDIVDYLQPMVATCANIIMAYRAENDRQLTHAQLEDSVSRLAALMASLSSAVLFEDSDRKVQFANEAFCNLFSIPVAPEHLVGADCAESAKQTKFMFENPDSFVERIDTILEDERPVSGEWLKLADGRVFSRDFTPILVGKKLRGYLWHYQDVTVAAEANEQLKAIVLSTHDAVVGIDGEGYVSVWPEAAERLFGLTKAEAVSMKLLGEIIDDAQQPCRTGLSADGIHELATMTSVPFRCSYRGRSIKVILTQMHDCETTQHLAFLDIVR